MVMLVRDTPRMKITGCKLRLITDRVASFLPLGREAYVAVAEKHSVGGEACVAVVAKPSVSVFEGLTRRCGPKATVRMLELVFLFLRLIAGLHLLLFCYSASSHRPAICERLPGLWCTASVIEPPCATLKHERQAL